MLRHYKRSWWEFNFEVPFVLVPGIFLPPFAGGAPWAGGSQHLAGHAMEIHASGLVVAQFHTERSRRAYYAQGGYCAGCFRLFFTGEVGFCVAFVLLAGYNKTGHTKTFRA